MSGSSSERPVPQVNEDDDRLLGDGSVSDVSKYEPKTFSEKLALSRQTFAQNLVGWCVGLIFILALVNHAFPREGTTDTVIDVLKLIVTTALGYVFGRSASKD